MLIVVILVFLATEIPFMINLWGYWHESTILMLIVVILVFLAISW
jgi:hypothetical protein